MSSARVGLCGGLYLCTKGAVLLCRDKRGGVEMERMSRAGDGCVDESVEWGVVEVMLCGTLRPCFCPYLLKISS